MAHLTVRGSLCRGVSSNESQKRLQHELFLYIRFRVWICWQNKNAKLVICLVDVIIM